MTSGEDSGLLAEYLGPLSFLPGSSTVYDRFRGPLLETSGFYEGLQAACWCSVDQCGGNGFGMGVSESTCFTISSWFQKHGCSDMIERKTDLHQMGKLIYPQVNGTHNGEKSKLNFNE
ncbi:hypothetical protein F0562_025656 [Nyssa sinensis]|uniref:Uncharacterized protein n=1 Tax=Nyssa sinensis TaxID=561372 RepID=A0A5J5B8M1_9ASTE|nr:hypothetical protein F0562_025656 [Nyssa sinensis]